MEAERYTGRMIFILNDGSRLLGNYDAVEVRKDDRVIYTVELSCNGKSNVGISEQNFFDALCIVRLELGRFGMLPYCFGASENVYPSPMQENMGPVSSAYRTEIGMQALSKDIVNIFEFDETINPVTVDRQEAFHQRWAKSLGGKANP